VGLYYLLYILSDKILEARQTTTAKMMAIEKPEDQENDAVSSLGSDEPTTPSLSALPAVL
jgi:hypothetical protein